MKTRRQHCFLFGILTAKKTDLNTKKQSKCDEKLNTYPKFAYITTKKMRSTKYIAERIFLLRLIIFDKTKLCLFCLVSEDVTNRIFTSRFTEVGAIGNRRVGRYSACDTAYV